MRVDCQKKKERLSLFNRYKASVFPYGRGGRFVRALTVVMLFVTGFLLWYSITNARQSYRGLAMNSAESFFESIVVTRRWNSLHDGVYVPVTAELQPNPYLIDPLRDITDNTNRLLTKVNPAFMTRLIGELMSEHLAVAYKITSLNPLNPMNAPDEWEEASLVRFEEGSATSTSRLISRDREEPYLQYMAPLVTEHSCLSCHAHQGYQEGDVRGGIRVSIPYSPYRNAMLDHTQRVLWAFGGVFMLIMASAGFFGHRFYRVEAALHETNSALEKELLERKRRSVEIEYLSFHDTLTGLYNRRFYEEELRRLDVPRNLPLTLMMVDVNGLKLTNDAFGHAVGDRLLKSVGDALQNTFRQDDIIARIGGDEFAILLPHTDEKQADRLKERLICRLSGETVEELPLSVACGWAVKTDSNNDMRDIFAEAEDQMYQEKIAKKSSYRYQTMQLIMQTLYAKSSRERQHAERVSQLCGQIGTAMDLSQTEIDQLITVGEMHDIGKISIDNEILDKEGLLDDSEWEQIQRHPRVGHSILSSVSDYGPLADYVLAHHEHWDGSGYPNGWKGEVIPLLARIVAVADVYDAMTSERPYRQTVSNEKALAELQRCSGSQFDPEVVKVFVKMMDKRKML